METMKVHWQKYTDSPFLGWCRFDSDLLNDPRLEFRLDTAFEGIHTDIVGVYIIWTGSDNRTILKVGSGIIKDRFRKHLSDPEIQAYRYDGLYVTWTVISPSFKPGRKPDGKERGIEKFLGWLLNPKLAERFPANVEMVAVNPPEWDEPVNLYRRNPFSLP